MTNTPIGDEALAGLRAYLKRAKADGRCSCTLADFTYLMSEDGRTCIFYVPGFISDNSEDSLVSSVPLWHPRDQNGNALGYPYGDYWTISGELDKFLKLAKEAWNAK